MAFKVKSFFKGIFRIFEQKEEEMQIGAPTDVKHVAHIGSDGPSATTPSWMNDFKSAAESSTGEANAEGSTSSKPRHKSRDSGGSSPTKKSKHGRRRSKDPAESPSADSSRRTRRHHRTSKTAGESGPTDIPDIPKNSHRKKSKDSTGGRSEISAQSNYNGDSMTDLSFTSLASAGSASVTGA